MINVIVEKELVAYLRLPYYKQGDDIAGHIPKRKNKQDIIKIFTGYKNQMETVVSLINDMIQVLNEYNNQHDDLNSIFKIKADTHNIQLIGPPKIIQTLVEKNIASLMDYQSYYEYHDN